MANRRLVVAIALLCVTSAWTFASLGCGGGGGGGGGAHCTALDPPDVAGTWNAGPVATAGDTCPSGLADEVCPSIQGTAWEVTQNGGAVTFDDGEGDVLEGCVSDNGEVGVSADQHGKADDCDLSLNVILSGDFGQSPAGVDIDFDVSGKCSGLPLSCSFTCTTDFAKSSTTARAQARAAQQTFADTGALVLAR